MNDLPDPAPNAGNNPISTNNPISQSKTDEGQFPVSPGVSKEVEAGGLAGQERGLTDVSGQEVEVPKEVASVGVKVQPTTVQIPQPVQTLGVKSTGSAPAAQPTAVALPLTDDQIAQGLKQSITSSWRWLAEFCKRRLKQLHRAFAMGRSQSRTQT